jgi:tetratricopeptide (TPR) repeat protein
MESDNSKEVQNLVRRGHTYSRRGEYARAIEAFNGAIDIDPSDAELYYHRGNAMAAAGRYADAIADFTQAVEIRPDYAEAYHNRATAYVDDGNL